MQNFTCKLNVCYIFVFTFDFADLQQLKAIKNIKPVMDQQKTVTKVILWCTPRSISTALTKCLSFVADSLIWFESYLGAMRYGLDARYPCSEDVVKNSGREPVSIGYDARQTDYLWCKTQLEMDIPGKKVIFAKDLSYNIDTRYDAIPEGYKHTFLIRHPSKVIPSWKRGMYRESDGPYELFKLSECPPSRIPPGFFFKETYDLYNHIKENFDSNPVLIDADDLLMNPGRVLKAYCNAVGIPYSDDLLQWDRSSDIVKTWNIPKQSLQLYTETFYEKAFFSSEFIKPAERSCPNLSEEDVYCIEASLPFYEKMYASRLVC